MPLGEAFGLVLIAIGLGIGVWTIGEWRTYVNRRDYRPRRTTKSSPGIGAEYHSLQTAHSLIAGGEDRETDSPSRR